MTTPIAPHSKPCNRYNRDIIVPVSQNIDAYLAPWDSQSVRSAKQNNINIKPGRFAGGGSSSQPNICKNEENGDKESQPCAPTDACSFGHPKHSGHISSYAYSGAVESIVEICNGRSISDFVADSGCDLLLALVKSMRNVN